MMTSGPAKVLLRVRVVLVVLLLGGLPSAAQARQGSAFESPLRAAPMWQGLPLGSPSLRETRTTERLAPGVTYTKIVRGKPAKKDGWTVDVAIVSDRPAARDLARRLRAAGFDAEVERLERPPDDPARGPLGYRVHSGRFATKDESDQRANAIVAIGIPVRGSVFTAEDGERTSGPWGGPRANDRSDRLPRSGRPGPVQRRRDRSRDAVLAVGA